MRFNTKRALSLLVAICMLVAMLPASLISASAAEVGTVYSYKFWECMKAAGATGTGTAFSQSYQASQDANVGSAKWMLGTLSNDYYAVSTAPYHIFGFGTKGGSDSITWKIEVPESAQYKATWNITEYGGSSPADVYLYKVGTAESYLYTIDYSGITSAGSDTNRAVSCENLMLEAGDYYLTVKQLGNGNEAYRYFTHKSFDLEVTGAYNANEITAVVLDRTDMALGMDSIDFITPSVLPAEADDGSVVYTFESSDENVVIVDEDGLVMPIGPGFATIKVSVENGKFATANVLVTESVTFEYDFTKGYSGPWSSSWKNPLMITYADTMAGSPNEIKLNATNIENGAKEVTTDPWAFHALHGGATLTGSSSFAGTSVGGVPTPAGIGAQNCGKGTMRGYTFVAKNEGDAISMKILVPSEGTFTPSVDYSQGSGYGSASFYLAPIDAVNPLAEEYLLGNVNLSAGALTDHVTTEFDDVDLSAGEYIVSLAGPGCVVTFWQNFALTNPNAVKSATYSRDSLNIAVGETAEAAVVVLPETAPDKSLSYVSSNDEVATVDEDGNVTGISEGTAVITATCNANESISDSITINVGGKVFYYDYMKSAGFMPKPGYRDDKYLKDSEYSKDFKYIRSGSADEVAKDHESYGWKIGENVNSSDWTWSQSAELLGLFVYVKNVSEDADGNAVENGYATMHLDVPVAGNYDLISVHSDWTGGFPCDYYFAPVTAANPIDAQYKVGSADHKTETGENHKVEEVIGEVAVPTAGEYVLVYYSESASPVFLYGVRLSDADVNVPVETITLDKTDTIELAGEETVTATATVLPANASDKTVIWSSSNDSIATVVDGVVTPVGAGYATITATANDGSGVKASFIVRCNMELKYTYDIRGPLAALYSKGNDVAAYATAFAEGYAASISAGSAPWMYYAPSGGSEYFNYTASSNSGFGVFGMNNSAVGYYNTIKIRVDEGAKYTGMLKITDWAASNNFDVYIAPVTAADKVAEEYNVGSYVATTTSAITHGYEFPLDTVDMPAGEYYVSFKVTKANGGTLIALFDLKLYKSGELAAATEAELEVGTIDGASIRTSGNQGLRFVSSLKKNADFGKVVEYGTLLIPTAYLNGTATNLTLGYKAGQNKMAAKVPAKFLYTDTDEEVSFTAVLTNIAPANYTREISARAYAIYEDENGNRKVVYGDTITSRSPYTVAQNGLADPNASEEDKAVFQAIVDAVENAAE